MLTYDELVNQANNLPLTQRLSLLESLAKSVKDEVNQSSAQAEKSETEKVKNEKRELRPLNQIEGMLKPKGPMYSDEDVEEILQERLAEKYGL